MSHEVSTTVKVGGRWVNLATVVNGKKIGEAAAVARYRAGKQNALGGRSFDTEPEASSAAQRRSRPEKRPRKNPFRGVK